MAFNHKHELDILSRALGDPAYRERARRTLSKHTFTDTSNGDFWKIIASLPSGETIDEHVLDTLAEGMKDKDRKSAFNSKAKQVMENKFKTSETSLSMLETFVLYQHLSSGIKSAIRHLKSGELEAAQSALKTATTGAPAGYDTTDWIEDFQNRQSARLSAKLDPSSKRCVPTRLRRLDKWLNGGLHAQQLGLIVGTTGRGKSHFAVHLGFWAAAQGFTTLHITTEMSSMDVSTRYDSKMLGIASSTVEKHDHDETQLEVVNSKYSRVLKRLQGKLRIIATPLRKATFMMLENAIEDMTNDGRPIDLLIVDCGDHLQPSRTYKDYRLDQSSIYWELKSLATEMNIPVWATTQAPKEVVDKIAAAENVADSYDKARIADVIWTLNQTNTERHASVMRGFLAKNRKGETGKMSPMEVDLSISHFQETVETLEMEDEE